MATLIMPKRPPATADPRRTHPLRNIGPVLGLVGVTLVGIAAVGNFAAAAGIDTDSAGPAGILAWTFGLTTAGLGLIKVGIALVLVAIIHHLWIRVESVGASLASLHPVADPIEVEGQISTGFGRATVGRSPPEPLLIHKVAQRLWLPMLAMGAMALGAGLIVSLVRQGETAGTELFRQQGAWAQGLQFLGEGLLLSGISFLLGTILHGLRSGGGEVQHRLGLPVHTLKMPLTAKLFIALMAVGMMASIVQFVLYVVVAGSLADDPSSFASWSAWLAPFRELALGVLLAGVVLALVTIGNVLGFQFDRIKNIVNGPRAQEVN